jgi:hypothetical protein
MRTELRSRVFTTRVFEIAPMGERIKRLFEVFKTCDGIFY